MHLVHQHYLVNLDFLEHLRLLEHLRFLEHQQDLFHQQHLEVQSVQYYPVLLQLLFYLLFSNMINSKPKHYQMQRIVGLYSDLKENLYLPLCIF